MYIVRWLMGHPILATWFLGAIAILLSIGNNSGNNKESHANNHATKQEQEVSTETTKSLETPSAVTSALIESDEKKVTEETPVKEAKSEVVETVAAVTAETESNPTKNNEVVTKKTVDSTVVTNRSYPDGLAIASQDGAAASKEVKMAKSVEEKPTEPSKTEPSKEVVEEAANEAAKADVVEEVKAVTAKIVTTESNEVVTKATVDSIVVTSRSYPDGLVVGGKRPKSSPLSDIKAAVPLKEQEVTNEAAATIEETPKPAEGASIQDLGQSSTEEMLLMAREAYWNNGLDEASQIYTQLIELEPTVIEHRGELGNVYWRQGYPEKAAELYSEIAIPMIEQGNSERVANMIGFIGLFYPDRAAEIHKRLQAATH